MTFTFRRRLAGAVAGRARKTAVLGAVAATALTLAACSSGSSGSSASSSSSSSSSSGSGSSDSSATKNLTIGLVDFDPTSLGAEVQVKAMNSAFQAAGWKVKEQSSSGDISNANTICTQFVTQHVSAIVTEVWTADQLAQCLTTAGAQNIPVFLAASDLGKGTAGAISTTGAGPINNAVITALKKQSNAQVFAINYTPGTPCRERQEDFDAKMKAQLPNVKITNHAGIIPGAVQDATAATQAFLNGHPASSGAKITIWTCDADQATGALSALRQTGRSGIPIYTWDLGKESVSPIKSGDFTATLVVPPTGMGTIAVSMVKQYMQDKKAKQYNAPTTIVTAKNVDSICSSSPALCQ